MKLLKLQQYNETDYNSLFGPRPGFIPFSSVIDFLNDTPSQNAAAEPYQSLWAGGTLLFTNPWDSFELLISAGTNYLDCLITENLASVLEDTEVPDVHTGFGVEIASGLADTSLFAYDIKANVIFNEAFSFSEFNNVVSVSSDIPLNEYFYLGLIDTNIFIFNDLQNDSLNYNLQNIFDVELQMLTRTGSSVYEKAGFVFGLEFVEAFNYLTSAADRSEYEFNLYPYMVVYIPKLIPLSNQIGKVKGFPAYFTFNLQPNKQTLYNGSFNILWYANEIQNGAHYIPLYFNKIEFSSFFAFGREYYLENTNTLIETCDNIFNQRSIGPTTSYKEIALELCLKSSYNSGALAGNSMFALKFTLGLLFDEFTDHGQLFYTFGFNSAF